MLYKSVQRGKGIDKYSLIRKGLTDGYGFETVAKKLYSELIEQIKRDFKNER